MPAGSDGNSAGSAVDAAGAAGSDAALGDATAPQDVKADGPPDAIGPTTTGFLSVTETTKAATDIDLTVEGTTDWVHWGRKSGTTDSPSTSGFDRMAAGSAISALGAPPSGAFTGSPLTGTWANGAPLPADTATDTGVFLRAGDAATFTVAATTAKQTLRLYTLTQQCAARVDVALSDHSAGPGSASKSQPTSFAAEQFTVIFAAGSAEQQLTVTFTDTHDSTGPGTQAICGLMHATLQ